MPQTKRVYVVLTRTSDGTTATTFDDSAVEQNTEVVDDLASFVARLERDRPRWVWDDTTSWYPGLLAAGVRVERCIDLRHTHAILRNSELSATSELATAPQSQWDAPPQSEPPRESDGALFDLEERAPIPEVDSIAEWRLQREAIATSTDPARISLLLAAESAGALIACEIKFAGLPWHREVHEKLLAELLGPRPKPDERPEKLDALLREMRGKLDDQQFNPDSPVELLKALRRAGLRVESTRSWELKKLEHPAIAPLLEYKKLARLASANGWQWLDSWVAAGRFRPEYVPGAAATGRWGASGGGALQLPKQVRAAVVADPGWKLVVADAAQLEPRILAGLSHDAKMAKAGDGDIYEGIVASGAVKTRAEAKIAMLGAMYGGTTGDSGRLMPALTRAFPTAIAMVEAAARAGEKGEIVSTRLGRSSPRPSATWRDTQGEAYGETSTESDQRRARSQARSWGRFTRNFIVQGTAAEWALCWMAGLRRRLWQPNTKLTEQPHLVFFLHDELIVHCPQEQADRVVDELREAAAEAGRLIFGDFPVKFPITAAIVDNYAEAQNYGKTQ
jgi:DNA polymerase I